VPFSRALLAEQLLFHLASLHAGTTHSAASSPPFPAVLPGLDSVELAESGR
jgi:hypothetical protein